MTRTTKLGLLRFWIWERREPIGVLLAALAGLALLGLLIVVAVPRGPGDHVTGVIVGMGYAESEDLAGHPIADVRIGDRLVTVSLPNGTPCRVGGRIRLWRRPLRWGEAFIPDLQPCPFRAGFQR